MDVGVIGAGNMGRAIARRLVAGGHAVHLADHSPEKAEAAAAEAAGQGPGRAEAASDEEAVRRGEVVILATRFNDSKEIARQLGGLLDGKVVVDIANPLNETYDALVTDPTSSAAEEIQRLLPGASVVKAFNTTFAPVLSEGQLDGLEVDVFLAGDDADAKRKVAELVRSGGLRPIDVGGLQGARTLERMNLLLIGLQARYGLDFRSALKLVPEELPRDPLLGG